MKDLHETNHVFVFFFRGFKSAHGDQSNATDLCHIQNDKKTLHEKSKGHKKEKGGR